MIRAGDLRGQMNLIMLGKSELPFGRRVIFVDGDITYVGVGAVFKQGTGAGVERRGTGRSQRPIGRTRELEFLFFLAAGAGPDATAAPLHQGQSGLGLMTVLAKPLDGGFRGIAVCLKGGTSQGWERGLVWWGHGAISQA